MFALLLLYIVLGKFQSLLIIHPKMNVNVLIFMVTSSLKPQPVIDGSARRKKKGGGPPKMHHLRTMNICKILLVYLSNRC